MTETAGLDQGDPQGVFDAEALEAVRRFQPATFDERLRLRASLDPAFTKSWLDYSAGLFTRPNLDLRTRILVLTGQFTMTRYHDRLRDMVTAAINEDVSLREVLEVILQTSVYRGETILDGALETFAEVVQAHGRMDDVVSSQPPVDLGERDLEAERATWRLDDPEDPRLEPYLERYGWKAVSTAVRLRGTHALRALEFYDGFDREFGRLWQDHCYYRVYSRGVLDDRTRMLCVVGNLLAIGEGTQSREHMRGALQAGAQPREVIEVAMQGAVLFGHPNMRQNMNDVIAIAEDMGIPVDPES